MNHEMHLHPLPFERIVSGTKRIEVRINDEKRQKVSIGDVITFISRGDPTSTICIQVTDILHAPSFLEMFRITNRNETEEKLTQKVQAMYQYYSPEEETKHGIIGIGFKDPL